jgi:hypothetical protein
MQNVVKSGIPNKEDSDFIKLYMFEKERSRLKSEEIKISQRLEIIQHRLKEIQDYYDDKAGDMHSDNKKETAQKKNEEVKPDWKTMSIDY